MVSENDLRPCTQCGYLVGKAGSAVASRCPECGTNTPDPTDDGLLRAERAKNLGVFALLVGFELHGTRGARDIAEGAGRTVFLPPCRCWTILTVVSLLSTVAWMGTLGTHVVARASLGSDWWADVREDPFDPSDWTFPRRVLGMPLGEPFAGACALLAALWPVVYWMATAAVLRYRGCHPLAARSAAARLTAVVLLPGIWALVVLSAATWGLMSLQYRNERAPWYIPILLGNLTFVSLALPVWLWLTIAYVWSTRLESRNDRAKAR